MTQEWPGLPKGVKFDPSDQEIIWHLLAKVGVGNMKPHPFIDEFVPTVYEDEGICYTHPQNLPGVKKNGSVSHFFHRAIKAYNTGTRKKRKIHGDDSGDVRWHKTGRTKPVLIEGVQRGCKKIMVLYTSSIKGEKPEKTNWVMHQYHLGTGEDEKEGEYVISKVFYQQDPGKRSEKFEQDVSEEADVTMVKEDPVTPMPVIPDRRLPNLEVEEEPPYIICTDPSLQFHRDQVEHFDNEDQVASVHPIYQNQDNQILDNVNENENQDGEENKWWDSESQHLLNSQQLVEALSLCDEFLQSQSPIRDGTGNTELNRKPSLSDYAHLGAEQMKKDLEECQNLVLDPANIDIDTPPDFRLSQLEFGSQESFLAWGGSKPLG